VWWTCSRCGDEWLVPDGKVTMTPARLARKTAFHIDPLLAHSVHVEEQLNPRCEQEIYGDDLWKQRVGGSQGRRAWKPMVTILLLMIATVAVRSNEQTFAAAAPPAKVIVNDNGYHVAQVQYVLKSFGYSVVVDSDFGPQTLRAVRHFQKANGLPATGIVEQQTLAALGIVLGTPTTPANISSKPRRAHPTPPPVDPATAQDTPATPALPVIPATDPATPGAGQWHDLAMQVGWSENEWPILACIIQRESHGLPGVKNKHSSATGLLQILGRYYPGVNLYDPVTNLTIGLQLFQSRGWQPWTPVPKC
jgi:Putative peptidoglycan binding domain/Transglycosylase SLT domain